MRLVPDEGPIEDLAAASADPAFDDRVHARRLDVAEHGPDPGIGENGAGRSGVVRAAVADSELDLVCLLGEVHGQVAGLLGGPRPGGMHCDAEDADAPSGVLDHGQDLSLGAVQQVGGEEIARQDRLGLRAWRAFGITASRVACSARSAQSKCGRRGCRRCKTASWWRRSRISAIFHVSSH